MCFRSALFCARAVAASSRPDGPTSYTVPLGVDEGVWKAGSGPSSRCACSNAGYGLGAGHTFSHRDFKGSRSGRDPFVAQTNNRLDLHTWGQLQSRRIHVTTSQPQTWARLLLSHLVPSRAFTVPAPPSPSQSAIACEFTPSCASTSNFEPFEFEDQPGMSDDPGIMTTTWRELKRRQSRGTNSRPWYALRVEATT
ncbi:hypothetical protein B0H13DRAFT_1915862 [Mycena leptocephala]|nr:hypothetical protein B0H13DRAFT_1915862 [Mycena leptocephala]